MDEKEKIHAEMETRMLKFHETLSQIKANANKKSEHLSDRHIDTIFKKHEEARNKLEDLKKADEHSWKKIHHELDVLMGDLGEDMRKALAYFG